MVWMGRRCQVDGGLAPRVGLQAGRESAEGRCCVRRAGSRRGPVVKVPRSYCFMKWSWAVAVPQAHT